MWKLIGFSHQNYSVSQNWSCKEIIFPTHVHSKRFCWKPNVAALWAIIPNSETHSFVRCIHCNENKSFEILLLPTITLDLSDVTSLFGCSSNFKMFFNKKNKFISAIDYEDHMPALVSFRKLRIGVYFIYNQLLLKFFKFFALCIFLYSSLHAFVSATGSFFRWTFFISILFQSSSLYVSVKLQVSLLQCFSFEFYNRRWQNYLRVFAYANKFFDVGPLAY